MAYYFKRNESVAEAVRRIAGEEFDSVITQLEHANGTKGDEAIHEARKSVKKVRALLRLIQPELGDTYRAESKVLRKAGRTLSELRDASSVIEILDKLQEKFTDKLHPSAVDPIRRGLMAKKKRAEESQVPASLRKIVTTIKAAVKRVKTWPISADRFPAIEPGLEMTLRRGRAAFQRAQKRPRPENYHEWRKRIKDHWYHVRLLEGVWTEFMQGYEAALKDLETWLGDDHNLVLLREHLMDKSEQFGAEKSVDLVLRLIEKYQKELRDNAESFGQRIHREKPRQIVKRMRQLWEERQAEPRSLEEFEKAERKEGAAAVTVARAGAAS
jgi:CHAD domain-containing protein